jgi:hypothetical protein
MTIQKLVAGASATDPLASTGAQVATAVNTLADGIVISLAEKAFSQNQRALPAMATPPTITANGTSLPAGQTKGYLRSTFPDFFVISGGTPFSTASRIRSAIIGLTGGNGGTNDGSQCSFSRYRFLADANKIAFRVKGSLAAYRFLVDGQYASLAGTITTASAATPDQYLLMDFTSAGGRKNREIVIECMGDQGLIGVYVGATEKCFQAAKAKIKTVCLGDSYCFGSSATLLGDGVDAVMADYLGWADHTNSGSGGTGWATTNSAYTFLQRIQNGDLALSGGVPDVVCLQGSINDKNAAAADVTANCLAGLQSVRSQCPNALIFVFGVWPASAGTGGTLSIAANEAAIAAAVTAFADANTFFIPINGAYGGAWLEGTGTTSAPTGSGNADAWMSDNAHLGDYGCYAAGKLKATALLQALTSAS